MMVIMAEACQEQSVNGIPMTSSCYPCVTAVTYLVRGRPLCAQELINEVISEQQRAREESEKKLNLLIRRLDHLERAPPRAGDAAAGGQVRRAGARWPSSRAYGTLCILIPLIPSLPPNPSFEVPGPPGRRAPRAGDAAAGGEVRRAGARWPSSRPLGTLQIMISECLSLPLSPFC